ncbi:MAG: GNAT family N-acetyltransferase [Rhodothermus sp.]|nr:GNAT family N-acetyltransferase [Rhodothermus sp.]
MPELGPAHPHEAVQLQQLLRRCGLLDTGVPEQLDRVLVAREGARVIGMALLERYGADGLLRSVAVDPAWQRQGIGRRLVEAMLLRARQEGLRQVFLLTETARGFFEQLGFVPVPRTAVPPTLRAAPQFSWPVCASCQVMRWTNPAGPGQARSQST